MTKCLHRLPFYWSWCEVEVSPYGDTELQLVKLGGEGTNEDLDIGRFRCTQCGEIGYYTGLWRDFYEEGIPCPGSNKVER
jgi:hypothetical protein